MWLTFEQFLELAARLLQILLLHPLAELVPDNLPLVQDSFQPIHAFGQFIQTKFLIDPELVEAVVPIR